MALDRAKKLEELKTHLAAIAVISEDLKKDRKLFATEDGWTVPGEEFLDLGLDESPVSNEEVLDFLDEKGDALKSIQEREQMMKMIKSVSEAAVKMAPLLLAL